MSQKIYILINEAMPGYIKIGKTEQSLEDRVRGLDTTGVPLPFEVFYAAEVSDMHKAEKLLHEAFADRRVRRNREFFEIAPEQAVAAVRLAEIKNITPSVDYVETVDDQQALNEARKKRSRFNFKMVEIPNGAILTFIYDDTITCKVVDTNKVEYNGEVLYLAPATIKALALIGRNRVSVQGASYWTYEGETLLERRMRYEKGDMDA